jgi:hypothetical protein
MDLALQNGLFTAPFGPTYYRGFVDHNAELVPVTPGALVDIPETRAAARPRPLYEKWWLWTAVGSAAAGLGIGLGISLGTGHSSPPTFVLKP